LILTSRHSFLSCFLLAYIGGYISVFNDEWCLHPSTQVHEIGHNLRLQHSGENGEGKYDDRIGLMGISYAEDTTHMCFNLANSWELGWYGRRRKSLDFAKDPGFKGSIIGIVDYEHPAATDKLVTVRAVSSTFNYDVYIGLNLAAGFNRDTGDGINQVTVTIHGDEEESNLMAELDAGGTYRIPNFQGTKGLNIKVNSINLRAVPSFADVEVYIDDCPVGSTNPVCNACVSNRDCVRGNSCVVGTCNAGTCSFDTSRCPGNFELSLRTDKWGSETSWTLTNTCSGTITVQGGPYAGNTQYNVSQVVGQQPHKLALYDSGGDGIETPGLFLAKMDGLEVAHESGNFKYNEFFYFGSGSCGGGTIPTVVASVAAPPPAPTSINVAFRPAPVQIQAPSPAPISTQAPDVWNTLFFESFENGRSTIFNRGRFCRFTRTEASDGRFSVEIRNDRGANSAITTIPMTFSGYQQLWINFWYYTTLLDVGESFFLEFSSNGTSNFRIVRTFTMGTDFQNNQWIEATHSWDLTGTTRGSIRIRCGFSDAVEMMNIDQITLQGKL
jgi:hypothetical protein